MFDILVKEGEELKNQTDEKSVGTIKTKIISNVPFQKWKSKCIYYLEINAKDSILTKEFIEMSKTNDFDNYECMLATLKGIKEVQDHQDERKSELMEKIRSSNSILNW